MRMPTPWWIRLSISAAAVAVLFPPSVRAQNDGGQPYGGQTPDDIQQTVARIAYVDGNDASYSRGDDPDNWQAAVVNVPVTLGDRVYTGDGTRMELQVHGGAFVRLAPQTDLTALNLTDDVKQLSLSSGTASFRVPRLRSDEVFEVDTPNGAVTLDTPGNYRVDVDPNGSSRVAVQSGHVTVSADGGEIPVSSGNEISIQGFDNPSYDVVRLGGVDQWDRWVGTRDARFGRGASYQYVNADIVGAQDLDQYGRWDDVPQYGRVWTPASVAVGWTPYSNGQWMWQDPWGWTWVGAEPWGWAPYHYGRWVTYSSRWYWVPAGPRAAVAYSPALVGFVGGGPGFSASFSAGGGGYVGWFPLAPQDPFNPWWGPQRVAAARVTNVTYVNQTYVTVVNQNTFVSGGSVARNAVRDPQIVRQVRSAAVVRGPIPIVPTMASLRFAGSASRPAARPPAVAARRAVVTRVAPPPAPASFQAKARLIQQNHGAPVAPRAAAQLSIQAPGGARASAPIRPAAVAAQGRVGPTPRHADASVRPQPITAPRGKALATSDRPIAANPSVGAQPAPAPMRIAPGAVAASPAPKGGPAPAPAPPAGEAWRQRRVPPGQQQQQTPPPSEARPPGRNPAAEATPPPPAREAAPSRSEAAPPPRHAPPPPQREAPPPPQREAPPPPRREAAPEPRSAPPAAEGGKAAPRAQPPAKGNEKNKGTDKNKEKDHKKEEPPPPPSL